MKYKTIETYDEASAKFAEKYASRASPERVDIAYFMANIPPGRKILDIGAGGGGIAKIFIQRGYEVVAIDASKELCEIANNNGIRCIHVGIEEASFTEQSFNGVWCATVLMHLPRTSLSEVIKKIHTWIVDGGIFYISLFEGQGETVIEDGRCFTLYTEEELRALLDPYFVIKNFVRTDRSLAKLMGFHCQKK